MIKDVRSFMIYEAFFILYVMISQCRGVTWDKRKEKWIARISCGGIRKYIGTFDNEDDAIHSLNYEKYLLKIKEQNFDENEPIKGEIFKQLLSFNKYEVSNFGRVRSNMYGKYRILKQGYTKQGYLIVKLTNSENLIRTRTVHLLVAEVFLNHFSNGKQLIIVDHKDNDKSNNKVSNLQLITQRLNATKDRSKIHTGATLHKKSGRYFSRICLNGKVKYLGYFDTEKEASEAYQNALISHQNNEEITIKLKEYSSKYKGVSKVHKTNNYRATIFINGKHKNLGRFNNEEDAHTAYQNALLEKQIINL